MAKVEAYSDDDFVTMGRRYSCEDVDEECKVVRAWWARDRAVLATYGFGERELQRFDALHAEHTAKRAARPDAVAQKTVSIAARDAAVSAARTWVGRVTSLLGRLAQTDAALAAKLNEVSPTTDATLEAGVTALASLLSTRAGDFDAEAKVADRVAESAGVIAALRVAPGAASAAKTAPVADTRELDLLDGKLYVVIRDLNAAARKAVSAGLLFDRGEYVFKHLARDASKPKPPPAR